VVKPVPKKADYVPAKGDVVWLDFDPQRGREIKKTRPALVLSSQKYNEKTSLALFVPITSFIKGYPFELDIDTKDVQGVVLCDQVRSLDWQDRRAKFITKAPADVVTAALSKLNLILN
jgi:mRNA interferase MazF